MKAFTPLGLAPVVIAPLLWFSSLPTLVTARPAVAIVDPLSVTITAPVAAAGASVAVVGPTAISLSDRGVGPENARELEIELDQHHNLTSTQERRELQIELAQHHNLTSTQKRSVEDGTDEEDYEDDEDDEDDDEDYEDEDDEDEDDEDGADYIKDLAKDWPKVMKFFMGDADDHPVAPASGAQGSPQPLDAAAHASDEDFDAAEVDSMFNMTQLPSTANVLFISPKLGRSTHKFLIDLMSHLNQIDFDGKTIPAILQNPPAWATAHETMHEAETETEPPTAETDDQDNAEAEAAVNKRWVVPATASGLTTMGKSGSK
ncbi:hypothetical protein A1O3_03760 [Capronia epimyces CBS 606.96]|uniref:Uncharacterized protein n=1 Tax=Capronia epimyces CBS 606.96 TaxID=1182542 RepID=W9YC18_9EURO|nr:uncharacterized protein A1O3_03760 [Capronia epimyces CBS 606.96]EXJ86806.1 hypothetical protein A1O3_03760 [Capronia epimyces CBS 606.96]